MATYNQLSYGSKGSEVTELQKLLNQNGYTLDTDGNFGPKTQAAVKDYQQKNNLSVDGIVGTNTWGALTKASTGATANQSTTTAGTAKNNVGYQESDTVKQAYAMLQQQLSQKPGEYQSAWQTQLNDIIQKIQNREKFNYDLNADALYNQYKDQYMLQGQKAMMDTMGQAQAMTGGYGNSYAQSVGQQAYQGHMQQLNDKIPELYQLALSKYQMEGNEMKDRASLIAQMENQDYGRYRDQMSDYNAELDRLQNRYDTERDYDYGKWIDDRNYQYQQDRDKVSDEQWQKEFDEALRQFNFAHNLGEFDPWASSGGSSGGSGGRSSGKSSGSGYDPEVAARQKELNEKGANLVVDGIDGPKTQEAEAKYGNNGSTGGDGFTGSTYSEAAAYLKTNGQSASGLMTQSEWQRHKNGNNSASGEHEASSLHCCCHSYVSAIRTES